MKITIDDFNEWAKQSCMKWCKDERTRSFNKMLYLSATKTLCRTTRQKELSEKTLAGEYWCNSYPLPFVHPKFANWEEKYHGVNCSLVTDPSGCIVKHDTSYIAWKIHELAGKWPKETSLKRFSEINWLDFLAESGYNKITMEPTPGEKFIGIYPSSEEEETIAFWYETTELSAPPHEKKTAIVTTYLEKEFKILRINPNKLTWVKIE